MLWSLISYFLLSQQIVPFNCNEDNAETKVLQRVERDSEAGEEVEKRLEKRQDIEEELEKRYRTRSGKSEPEKVEKRSLPSMEVDKRLEKVERRSPMEVEKRCHANLLVQKRQEFGNCKRSVTKRGVDVVKRCHNAVLKRDVTYEKLFMRSCMIGGYHDRI